MVMFNEAAYPPLYDLTANDCKALLHCISAEEKDRFDRMPVEKILDELWLETPEFKRHINNAPRDMLGIVVLCAVAFIAAPMYFKQPIDVFNVIAFISTYLWYSDFFNAKFSQAASTFHKRQTAGYIYLSAWNWKARREMKDLINQQKELLDKTLDHNYDLIEIKTIQQNMTDLSDGIRKAEGLIESHARAEQFMEGAPNETH